MECPICKKDIDHLRFRSSRSARGDVFVDKYGDLEWDIEADEIDEEGYCCPSSSISSASICLLYTSPSPRD